MASLPPVPFSEIHLSSPKSPKYPFSPLLINLPPRPYRLLPRCLAVDNHPNPTDLRVVFTGGGTGGHIYPAIAIADELKIAHPSTQILFIGTPSGIESTTVASAGYDYASVPAARLTRPLYSPVNLLLPFRLLRSIAASITILRDFQPVIVVGTGGHVAAPVCLAAAVLSDVKLAIQEQNGFPGLTNRIVAPFAEKVFLAFNACASYFPREKCIVCGNPVRLSLRRYVSKPVARSHFFDRSVSRSKAEVVLVLGGTEGDNSINIAVLNMYYDMLSEHKNRFIIWQTGTQGYNEMESLVKNHRRLLLTPFLQAMDLAYAAADVVVSRSGAMICTEILTTGKPSILIPLPKEVDDHQVNNAYIMADIAGSKVLEEDELDSTSLETAINEVLGDEDMMVGMSEKALRVSKPNAATEIAECLLSLVKLPSSK